MGVCRHLLAEEVSAATGPMSPLARRKLIRVGQRSPESPPGLCQCLRHSWKHHRPAAGTCSSLLLPSRPTCTASARMDGSTLHLGPTLPPGLSSAAARSHVAAASWLCARSFQTPPCTAASLPFQDPGHPRPSFCPKPSLPCDLIPSQGGPGHCPDPRPFTLLPHSLGDAQDCLLATDSRTFAHPCSLSGTLLFGESTCFRPC